MAKGASVIPGARNLRQVESNLRPRDFKLSAAQARPPSRMRAHFRLRGSARARARAGGAASRVCALRARVSVRNRCFALALLVLPLHLFFSLVRLLYLTLLS